MARATLGFTLLELMLVMGILVAISAIALPTVTRSFSSQALVKAADRVRVSMGQARVRAIRTGQIHAVGYLPGRGWIDVASLDQLPTIASKVGRRLQDQQRALTSNYDDDLLPGGVTFVAGQTYVDARATDTSEQIGDGSALRTILFYPDGTSQDARLTLQNEDGRIIDVTLRGLTGTASVRSRYKVVR
ncbi:GspH/FimT family pseudopilin [Mariniblastus sp.]|nr:GspH/FimT family pseudopilin [Mariniblastus sp.]